VAPSGYVFAALFLQKIVNNFA
ncbi:hypothetical protein pipiens_020246, partial [Culex pipiens pipiens]